MLYNLRKSAILSVRRTWKLKKKKQAKAYKIIAGCLSSLVASKLSPVVYTTIKHKIALLRQQLKNQEQQIVYNNNYGTNIRFINKALLKTNISIGPFDSIITTKKPFSLLQQNCLI